MTILYSVYETTNLLNTKNEITMDEKSIIEFISSHSVFGAGAAAILAMLYKIWRILKVDRKEDSLDNAERKLRDELRDEIKVLKEDIKILSNEVRILRDTHIQCQDENAALKGRIKWLETCLRYCQLNHPPECPLIAHLGEKQFRELIADRGTDEQS